MVNVVGNSIDEKLLPFYSGFESSRQSLKLLSVIADAGVEFAGNISSLTTSAATITKTISANTKSSTTITASNR